MTPSEAGPSSKIAVWARPKLKNRCLAVPSSKIAVWPSQAQKSPSGPVPSSKIAVRARPKLENRRPGSSQARKSPSEPVPSSKIADLARPVLEKRCLGPAHCLIQRVQPRFHFFSLALHVALLTLCLSLWFGQLLCFRQSQW